MDQNAEQVVQGESLDAIARRQRSWLGSLGWWSWRLFLISFVGLIGYVGWANDKPARLPGDLISGGELPPDGDDADTSSPEGLDPNAPPPETPTVGGGVSHSIVRVPDFNWQSLGSEVPQLITVTPAPAPKASLVKIGAWEEEAKPLPASVIRLNDVASLHSIGELLVVVATVVGEEGVPMSDQVVEWSLDRQGIGDLLAAGGADDLSQPGNRLTPFFARSHTARNAYRLDERLQLSKPLEIQPGQAWCIITGRSPGDMVLTASCPSIASIQKRQVDARVHWHDAAAKFPESLVARAGGQVKLPVSVANSRGEPQSGYRTRFELVEPAGAAFSESSRSIEIASNTAGNAEATLRQEQPAAATSKVRIQLFGGQAYPGKAVALAETVIDVEWQESPVLVQIQAPESATTSTWLPITFHARMEGSLPPEGAEVVAIFDPGLDVSLTDPLLGTQTSLYQPPILIAPPPDDKAADDAPPPIVAPEPEKPAKKSEPPALPAPPKVDAKKESEPDKPESPLPVPKPKVADTDPPKQEPPKLEPPKPALPKSEPPKPAAPEVQRPELGIKPPPVAPNAGLKPSPTVHSEVQFTPQRHVSLGPIDQKNGVQATLGIRAIVPSKRWVRLEVRQGGRVLASKQVAINFVAPTLLVQKSMPSRWRVEQPNRYTVTVTNPGAFAVEKVEVRDELMPGLRIEKAEALRFSDHLLWQIDRLAPGEKREFEVVARPTQLVDRLALRTWAEAPDMQTAETYSEATVTGLAGVSLSIYDLADPVEIGKEVEYLIEVENRGNGPAYQVRFDVETPDNLRLLTTTGSLVATIDNGKLVLPSIPELPVGSRLYARVRAKCIAKGEARFSITLRHEAGGNLGIVSQESTNIYQVQNFPPPVQFSGDVPDIQE